MAALLIPLSLVLQAALFGPRRADSYIKAAVVVGLLIVALTEILSFSHWLSFGPVLAAWIVIISVQGALLFLSGRFKEIKKPPLELEWPLLAAAAIVLVCGIVAFLGAPNNFDSMTYHLPRIMHWIQNRSVAHYPANDLRQLAFPPGASFIMLHLELLAGSDRFINGAQWLAFVGTMIGAWAAAEKLGAKRPGRVLAVTLAASIPMAVLQAETTQNDLLAAFWLLCFAVFALKEGDYELSDLLWLSASLGLAVLTKPTGLVFGAPLLLVVLARQFRRSRRGELGEEEVVRNIGTSAMVLALALAVSAPSLLRNKTSLGSFLPEDGRTIKATVGLRQTTACAMKNALLELPLPPLWSAALAVERHVLRLDPEDPGNNFEPLATRTLGSLCRRLIAPDEDFAGSPVHFILLLWALGILSVELAREREDPWSDRTALAVSLLFGFLIFSAFFKWQEWANRLMVPLFVLGAPLTAQILEDKLVGSLRSGVLVFLAGSGLLYAATATGRPLIVLPENLTSQWQMPSILTAPREEAYALGYARIQAKPLRAMLETIIKDKCGYVGLSLGRNDWEYPWWVLLASHSQVPFKIKDVNVGNASAKLPAEFPSELLCGVVESQGGVMMYFDAADMKKMHEAGHHEPPLISEIRKD